MHITRDFIRDDDITREFLEKNLRKIAALIEENNKWNLTDVNVICEEVFGKILNNLFGYELVATSAEISGNFIAVDLIDYSNGVAFQVTSRKDRKKITDTVNKFNKSYLIKQIDSLNILVLGFLDGHKYDKPQEIYLDNNNVFSFGENVFDFERLIEEAAKKGSNQIFVDMYDNTNMIFDSGRLKMPSIVKATELLSQREHLSNPITGQATWKKGYGTVQLSAFIPEKYGEEICAMLEIRKYDMAGAYITFGQDVLISDFFVDEETFKLKHSMGREENETLACLQIQCVRFLIDAHSAYQLYLLFTELHKEYVRAQNQILEELGAKNFEKKGELFYLKSISEIEWEEIKYFAQNHDCCAENGCEEWNVFISHENFDIGLTILPYANGTKGGAYIHSMICVEPSNLHKGMLDVYWKPKRVIENAIKVNLDNVTRWKADYTLNWLEKKLLPEAHRYYIKSMLGSSETRGFLSKLMRHLVRNR